MRASLKISPHIAPKNKWHWAIIFDNGHIWKVSETFDTLDQCFEDADQNGRDLLVQAMSIPD